MKWSKRTVWQGLGLIMLMFLVIHYWSGIETMAVMLAHAMLPLVMGCIIAYLLNILISFYERHYFPRGRGGKFRRPVCLVAALVTLVGIGALMLLLIVPELAACVGILGSQVPPFLERISRKLSVAEVLPEELRQMLETVDWKARIEQILPVVVSGLGGAAGVTYKLAVSLVSSAASFFIGLIFAVYLLLDKEKLMRQCRRLLNRYLPPHFRDRLLYILSILNENFHRFVVGQCAEACILGTLCAVGMLIFRFPYAGMIGTLIGFTALVPIAGAYIGAGVGAVMILTQSPVQAVLFLLYIVVLQQLEGNLIYPKVVGLSIGLPAIWVLAAITIGGSLGGIPGMLLAVPITASFYRFLREDIQNKETAYADRDDTKNLR